MVAMQLSLETYTPSEAEEITQVTQATVRNWRRAGHLARHQGHARYDIAEILLLSSMKALVSRGVSPEIAKGYSGEIARATFQSLIFSHKAYSQSVKDAARAETGPVSVERLQRLNDTIGGELTSDMVELAEDQKAMTDAAERSFGLSGIKAPAWLIIWANGELQFYYDEDISEETFFGDMVFDEFVQGPVILFCLGAMAKMVLDRLPRPAIKLVGEA